MNNVETRTIVRTTENGETEEDTIQVSTPKIVEIGVIYTVVQYTDANGKRHYYYRTYNDNRDTLNGCTTRDTSGNDTHYTLVKNNADGRYYRVVDGDVGAVTCDMNHYMEQYRFASTPWIVSNIKGDAKRMELNRLFRFHTISDGDNSNREIKISIQNIKTDDMTFDVIVRDINDTDEMPVVLERFSKCTMIPGDKGYIAYKIGAFDGTYGGDFSFV
jgi:hypothetical protein